jgi:hypothetical protein
MKKLINAFRIFANAHEKTANTSLGNSFPYLSHITHKIAVFWTVNHRLVVGCLYADTTSSNKLNTCPEPEVSSFLCNLGKLLLEGREATQIIGIFNIHSARISNFFPTTQHRRMTSFCTNDTSSRLSRKVETFIPDYQIVAEHCWYICLSGQIIAGL